MMGAGAAVEVSHQATRSGSHHGQSRAVITRLALSESSSFMWAAKFLVLHHCMLVHHRSDGRGALLIWSWCQNMDLSNSSADLGDSLMKKKSVFPWTGLRVGEGVRAAGLFQG